MRLCIQQYGHMQSGSGHILVHWCSQRLRSVLLVYENKPFEIEHFR